MGRFHVLKGEVPLILVMDFLTKVHPSIDFCNKRVTCYIGSRKFELPTSEIGNGGLVVCNSSSVVTTVLQV